MNRDAKEQSSGREAQEVDLLLEGGKVLNVYTGEILKSNVVVKGRRIVYVGPRSDIPAKGPFSWT